MPKRKAMLDNLLSILNMQGSPDVEILVNDGPECTGHKRNQLLQQAQGVYTVFIDDDDEVSLSYIPEILKAAAQGCDAIAIQGYMTTNGTKHISWRISKDYPYVAVFEDGKEVYLRFNNHISPIKREIAVQFKFPEISNGEDYAWAKAIHDSGIIKTEAKTEGEIYHYKFITNK